MFEYRSKTSARRNAIRENRPADESVWQRCRDQALGPSLIIVTGFWVLLSGILLMRESVVRYRPGQYVPHDITARVDFNFFDTDELIRQQDLALRREPRVYLQSAGDVWESLRGDLLSLPERTQGLRPEQLDPPLHDILDSASLAALSQDRTGPDRQRYNDIVNEYINQLEDDARLGQKPLVVLKNEDWLKDLGRAIVLDPRPVDPDDKISRAQTERPAGNRPTNDRVTIEREVTVTPDSTEIVSTQLPHWVTDQVRSHVGAFELALKDAVCRITLAKLQSTPTHIQDEARTAAAQKIAVARVTRDQSLIATKHYVKDQEIVAAGTINDHHWQLLQAENRAYVASLASGPIGIWQARIGLVGVSLIITILLAAYVARYQPKVVRNHARASAIGALLLAMLLVTQLAAIGSSSLLMFAIAPTILATIILTIAYDQRLAMGMATIHCVLVTVATDQTLGFFLILWVGVLTACYLLDEVRTRSKLIEVGGLAALAMIAVKAAVGALQLEPIHFIVLDGLYAGAAGLAAGFIALGILPFIERSFRITTSMTLLELADVSQPLLRRLALEAPGTYNHSLQVATLAEAAAQEIKANSLVCRVGAYYHDIGKIIKSDYFVENQLGSPSRHLNLSPSVSLLIIIGHVKDGVEMAKEYNLPSSLLPFIQQHHGTTLVEFFYAQACSNQEQQPDQPAISDMQYRYPGPKPKTRETAILMVCDAVESACRSMQEPTAARIEALVHEITMKRLLDGQFDDCDLTMRDLERIEKVLCKTLLAIYHGRIAYPSTSALTRSTNSAAASPSPAMRSA